MDVIVFTFHVWDISKNSIQNTSFTLVFHKPITSNRAILRQFINCLHCIEVNFFINQADCHFLPTKHPGSFQVEKCGGACGKCSTRQTKGKPQWFRWSHYGSWFEACKLSREPGMDWFTPWIMLGLYKFKSVHSETVDDFLIA